MNKNTVFAATLGIVLFAGLAAAPAWAGPWQAGKAKKLPLKHQKQPTEHKAALRIVASPIMPPNAERSGYCCMLVDVDKKGMPENIRAGYCSENYFKKPAIVAIRKWRFAPAIKDGKPRAIKGQIFIQTFLLSYPNGKLIPDRDGLLVGNGKPLDTTMEQLCSGPDIA